MLLRTTLLKTALALLVAVAVGGAERASAQMAAPPLQPGAYFGIWHGDNVRFNINRMDRSGRFSGTALFAPDSNFPGYQFAFSGRIDPDGSLFIQRQTTGNQIAQAGPPMQQGRVLVWQGIVQGQGLNGPADFQLTAPLR